MTTNPIDSPAPSLTARVMRSSAWSALGYFGSQGLRLASNLILTRLLFPEAFGMMTLVSVFLVGLTMFSDMGTGPAIMHHKRGEEADFLNTAFTLQMIRGGLLFGVTCLLAYPVSLFYNQPELAMILPASGITLLMNGLMPTRIESETRHLRLGRLTVLDMIAQIVGLIVTIGLSWALHSVWALVFGGIAATLAKLILTWTLLPGLINRPAWEKQAAHDLMRFGFWLFLSTACGFIASQGDKAVLGKYLTLDQLGIYNIGYFLASFPLLLGYSITGKMLIPIYRESSPAGSAENFARLRKMRFTLSIALIGMMAILAFMGQWIVGVLYDDRYTLSGAVLVLVAISQLPQVIGMSYDHAALAAGDSRNFFYYALSRAVLLMIGLILGAEMAGLVGAVAGSGLAAVLSYPVLIWLARRHHAWDPLHDLVMWAISLVIAISVIFLDAQALSNLMSAF